MKKILIILFIAIIVIIIFPKSAGTSGGGLPSPSNKDSYSDKECSCLGYKFNSNRNVADEPMKYSCIGIAHSCACVKHTIIMEPFSIASEIVPCE